MPIDVHIYVSKSGQHTLYNSVSANYYRSDLEQAGYGNGCHVFECPISWLTYTPGEYAINAYGINGTTNPQLDSSPKYYTVREATGCLDRIDYNELSGWAWKPDAPNSSISVHIYIRKLNGDIVTIIPVSANWYRSDLYDAGYGNGCHVFTKEMDWGALPREQLIVQVYAVDGSGYHPCFYNQVFDNRKEIFLLGQNDYDHGDKSIDFTTWMDSEVVQNCVNIGSSRVVLSNNFDNTDAIYAIANSSFCLINAHGSVFSVQCVKDNVYSHLTSDDLDDYPDGYFSNTRCVTLLACNTGYGGTSNEFNLVNNIYEKGAQTVIGFQDNIYYNYVVTNGQKMVSTTQSAGLWGKEYTYRLSQGCTVAESVVYAKNAVFEQSGHTTHYGFDNYYIAGNSAQVIKH